jgi:hypothetical protein
VLETDGFPALSSGGLLKACTFEVTDFLISEVFSCIAAFSSMMMILFQHYGVPAKRRRTPGHPTF